MRALAFVAVALLLAGCATTISDPPASQRAHDLVQLWRVDAPGETDATWLSLGEGVTLWSSCGTAVGSWRATDSLFIAGMTGSIQPWCEADAAFPGWLENATGWRLATPGHVQLLGADGAVLAKLSIDGTPPPSTDAPGLNTPPAVTDLMTDALRDPLPLPSVATPVTALSGRWIPSDASPGRSPFVEFGADHTWTGSDGCNGAGGRWLLGTDGLILTTSGASTAIGCENSNGPRWVGQAFRVGMVGDALTFYDANVKELGSFTRS
jgi:heat shock protein HslJ